MLTRHISVTRGARYHMLGNPDGDWSEIWFVLHGYGHLADAFLELCRPLESVERLIVAPEGLSRFYRRGTSGDVGASWMTRADRETEVSDYVAYLDTLHRALVGARPASAVRVNVLGFSQGVATAARWCVLGDVSPARLVLWAGGFPPDLDPERARATLGETRVELVLGERDPSVSIEGETTRLLGVLPRAEVRRFAGSHELDAAILADL